MFLRDDQALTKGWPIATGMIEGACGHLIDDQRVHHARYREERDLTA
ncbi:hypothetical protein ACWEPL_10250 [Nonomuraea sp. NPDC004186]